MRFLIIAICAALALQLCGCGGSGRKLEQTFPVEQQPTATNDAGVVLKVAYFKQSDHYLIVRLMLTNNGKDIVAIKNGEGASLLGYRATIDGQTFVAERRGATWNPWTGVVVHENAGLGSMELAPGTTSQLELRWDFKVSRKDYDWALTVTSLQVGDKKLADLVVSHQNSK